MATKETPPPPPTDAPPPKKGKKLLIIVLAAVILLIGLAGAAIVLLKPPADDEAHEIDDPKKKKKDEKPVGPPTYLTMEGYTMNIAGDLGDQFLRLELSAQFDDLGESERAKLYMPSIRNQVLLLLSSKKVAELGPKEGKEQLANEIKAEMNRILGPSSSEQSAPGGPVRAILFTEFVIQ